MDIYPLGFPHGLTAQGGARPAWKALNSFKTSLGTTSDRSDKDGPWEEGCGRYHLLICPRDLSPSLSARPDAENFLVQRQVPVLKTQTLESLCQIHSEFTQAWARVCLPLPQSSHLHIGRVPCARLSLEQQSDRSRDLLSSVTRAGTTSVPVLSRAPCHRSAGDMILLPPSHPPPAQSTICRGPVPLRSEGVSAGEVYSGAILVSVVLLLVRLSSVSSKPL